MALRIVVDKNTPRIVEVFSTLGDVEAIDTAAFASNVVSDADAIFVRSEVKVGPSLLEGSRVKFVGSTTIGIDHLDEQWLRSRGIAYANAPGCNANSVCEYILAALLVHATQTGRDLRSATLGIVGVGNVGSRVEKMATALGMRVLLNDPPLARSTGDPRYRPLDEVLTADIITLHVPLTRQGDDATLHLFDSRRISALRRETLLINSSRGPVVDNAALREALQAKKLGGAILDVWEDEPALHCALLDQVELGTPHIAGYSFDGKTNAVTMVYSAFCRFLGLQPQWSLNPDSLPVPECREVVLPADWRGSCQALDALVRKCYDIRFDDSTLRGIRDATGDELRRRFQKLRTSYRVRREFRATTVRGVGGAEARLLRELGFCLGKSADSGQQTAQSR